MKIISKILFGITVFNIIVIITICISPNISFASQLDNPVDWGKRIYGVDKIWPAHINKVCGKLKNLYEEGIFQDGKEDILFNIYQKQCTIYGGSNSEPSIFHAPMSPGQMTIMGRSCVDIQNNQINNLYRTGEIKQEVVKTYINECLNTKAPNVLDFAIKNKEIQLAAPIPIEGGSVIEASEKSYLFVYMVKMYKFVLGIAGIIAVGELVLAGFQVALSAGDSTRAENGKKRIIQTLEGLGILFTSAIILHTVNPVGYNFDENVDYLKEITPEGLSYYAQEGYLNPPVSVSKSDIKTAKAWWQQYKPKAKYDPDSGNNYDAGFNSEFTKRIQDSKDFNPNDYAKIWEHYKGEETPSLDPDTIMCEKEGVSEDGSFCGIAKDALATLGNVATKVYELTGHKLLIKASSVRSYDKQVYFYYCYKTKKCNRGTEAAYPGTSRHGMGKAIDVSLYGGVDGGRTIPMSWFSNFTSPLTKNNTNKLKNLLSIRQAFYTRGGGKWKRGCFGNRSHDEWWHYDWVSTGGEDQSCAEDLTDTDVKNTVEAVFEEYNTIPK